MSNLSPEICSSTVRTVGHLLDSFCIGKIIGNDFAHFGKVPSVPLANTHGIVVQLFVQIVQERNCLDKKNIWLGRFLSNYFPNFINKFHFEAVEAKIKFNSSSDFELLF